MAFLDESGFLLVPNITRTWSRRGHTPILLTAGHWTKISAISSVTVSPQRRRMGLLIRFHSQKNIRAPEVIGFLRHLLRHLRGPVVLLWDGSPVHRAAPVKRFLKQYPRLHAHRFPGYAPELNPDELVWAQLKKATANSVPKNIAHLRKLLQKPLDRLRHSQPLLRSCIHASDLPW